MSDTRERIAEAYREGSGQPIFPPALDALLSVVEAIAAERAAAELRAAAEACEHIGVPRQAAAFRVRADALDPS